ncbi:MAG: HlyD family efflux transporter periplasmic adaptor subunit [Alphaproteobacteria bacterium]|nr:HlyD family efflux transporter periplasmic adaptor subunit [Alphaproteobacteria bacterium]MCW5740694.1 HlyD family efflux transporter periplasmic adaptor subunit [Alphaproteobacteria bacterium]
MKRARVIVVVVVLLAVLGGGAWWWLKRAAPEAGWQGWVEADFVFVGADEAGRLEHLAVGEGRRVAAGAPLFAMEHALQDADLLAAQAALAEARARLARIEAAAQRPEEIAVLRASEARAKAASDLSEAEYERSKSLVAQGVATRARLEQAEAARDRDRAALAEVQRQIQVAGLGGRAEDIEAARRAVAMAEARVESAQTRLKQRTVMAPVAGLVHEVFYRPGEVVPAGRPVVSLLPPANVKLRFFVPQAKLPGIAAGQSVRIACDGCPADLTARISFVASQAEFTPPVIYSRDERAKLVFRVEAYPQQPEALRVGQPVSVFVVP